MNGATNESAIGVSETPNRQNGNQTAAIPPSDDPKKLALVMEENRVKINKGWVELHRLDQLLSRMDQLLKLRERPREAHSGATTVAPAASRPALVTEAA
jgi:hypothetical protein